MKTKMLNGEKENKLVVPWSTSSTFTDEFNFMLLTSVVGRTIEYVIETREFRRAFRVHCLKSRTFDPTAVKM